MKKDEKVFLGVLFTVIITFVLIASLGLYFVINENIGFLKLILVILSILFLFISIIIIISMFILYNIIKNQKVTNIGNKLIELVLNIFYPIIIGISKVLNIDVDVIRRVFTDINNFLVITKNIKVQNEKLMILLPHCIQNHKCKYKITHDIENCKICGGCDIGEILKLCKKYDVIPVVATGGTLAREWIKKTKPKAIIAVACERDLASGINDVKLIPVIGIINQRPNGPCFDTKVDIEKLEEAIKIFLKEG